MQVDANGIHLHAFALLANFCIVLQHALHFARQGLGPATCVLTLHPSPITLHRFPTIGPIGPKADKSRHFSGVFPSL